MRKTFISNVVAPSSQQTETLWFIFQDQRILVHRDTSADPVPLLKDIQSLGLPIARQLYLGMSETIPCYAVDIKETESFPDEWQLQTLRQAFTQLGESLFNIASRAIQILNWDKNHQYCGRCGAVMQASATERVKICPQCHLHNYPRLSPAVIVLVTRDDEILLARSPHFLPGIFSALAGFVEPGETIEETAQREVFEEVGIIIKTPQYVLSQSWPFPDSLMLGLLAEYAAGEIKIDAIEIEEAHWYHINNLPNLPAYGTIARKLVEFYLANK